jgi:hypothetical protein
LTQPTQQATTATNTTYLISKLKTFHRQINQALEEEEEDPRQPIVGGDTADKGLGNPVHRQKVGIL